MKAKKHYPMSFFSGIVMLLTLLCLTVGTFFVYHDQQLHKGISVVQLLDELPGEPGQNAGPFDDTEESPETCNTTWETEYLPEEQEDLVYSNIPLQRHISRYKGVFIFFHVESFSPPPDPLS